jgi:hypothetical protein
MFRAQEKAHRSGTWTDALMAGQLEGWLPVFFDAGLAES